MVTYFRISGALLLSLLNHGAHWIWSAAKKTYRNSVLHNPQADKSFVGQLQERREAHACCLVTDNHWKPWQLNLDYPDLLHRGLNLIHFHDHRHPQHSFAWDHTKGEQRLPNPVKVVKSLLWMRASLRSLCLPRGSSPEQEFGKILALFTNPYWLMAF